jgi:hypothetical protein
VGVKLRPTLPQTQKKRANCGQTGQTGTNGAKRAFFIVFLPIFILQ